MKAMLYTLGLGVVVAAVIGLALSLSPTGMPETATAQAQGGLAAPANVRAADGASPGTAVVSFDAVAGAAFYRIGWVSIDDIQAVQADDREWLDAFDFKDVENKGQTAQALKGLTPGVRYAFIAASVPHRFGNAQHWSAWTYLNTAPAPTPTPAPTPAPTGTPCPAGPGTVPSAPGGGTPTPAPGATATPAPAAQVDYDADDDGLIEISTLTQLDVIRHDLDGDGVSVHSDYAAAFPNAMLEMGCFGVCMGYELTADLDFDTNGSGGADPGDAHYNAGEGWLPIGDPETDFRFNTTFEGNGHTIANLYIRWPEGSHLGLFRAAGEDAEIRNVRLTGVRVSGKDQVGGLVGSSDGSIAGVSVAGRVAGVGRIGGLAGYNSGSISSSHSTARITGGGDRVGGLVGSSSGSIVDSYATGDVAGGGAYTGGLVGIIGRDSDGSISGSYATGNVTGDGDNVGGLIGYSAGDITASHATGAVTGEGGNVGGLAGDGRGAISGSYATGTVTGEGDRVGGLVGNSGGAISDSHATGEVTGRSLAGGLVGSSYDAITASYATGSVTGSGYFTSAYTGRRTYNSYVGGLAGVSSGTITASYATGSVTGEVDRVGGLVGYVERGGTIIASYAIGSVNGNEVVGGLVGGTSYSSSITASYATGSVTGQGYLGGLVGSRSGSSRTTDSYWDTQTTGQSNSAGGTGKTTRELQIPTGHTGIYANWNADWWDFGTSRQYPVLKYEGMDVGAQRQ